MIRLKYLLPFVLFFSFCIVFLSGIFILFGGLKELSSWSFLGLSGLEYLKLHVSFFLIFALSLGSVFYMKTEKIKSYLKALSLNKKLFGQSFYISLAGTIFFFLALVIKMPDFPKTPKEKPNLHVEKVKKVEIKSLKDFSQKEQFDLKNAISLLKIKGLHKANENTNFSEAAKNLGIEEKKLIEMFRIYENLIPKPKK